MGERMRFQIDGVRAGTTQPVRVELEGADLQSVMAQVAAMGIVQARVRPVVELGAGGGPPPIPGAVAGPPPIPAAAPAAYGGGDSYGSNAYAGQPAAHQPPSGFPPAARKANNTWKILLLIGIPVAALLLVGVAVAIGLWFWYGGSSAGKAAGTALEPALYVPESKEGEAVFSISANVPKVLALDASKNIRRQMNIDPIMKDLGLKITLDDVEELLIVGGGPTMGSVNSFAICKLKQDLNIPDILKSAETAGKPEAIEGFDVYQPNGAAAGPGPMFFVCKIGPKTYLGSQCTHDDLSTYLTRVRSGKKIAFSAPVLTALGETRGGDVVVCWNVGNDGKADAPRAVAAAIRVDASSVTGEFVALMKDDNAAKAAYKDYQDKGKTEVESYVPGAVVTQQGAIVKGSGSIKSTVIEENLKKILPVPPGR
jgi:hypothetical protein